MSGLACVKRPANSLWDAAHDAAATLEELNAALTDCPPAKELLNLGPDPLLATKATLFREFLELVGRYNDDAVRITYSIKTRTFKVDKLVSTGRNGRSGSRVSETIVLGLDKLPPISNENLTAKLLLKRAYGASWIKAPMTDPAFSSADGIKDVLQSFLYIQGRANEVTRIPQQMTEDFRQILNRYRKANETAGPGFGGFLALMSNLTIGKRRTAATRMQALRTLIDQVEHPRWLKTFTALGSGLPVQVPGAQQGYVALDLLQPASSVRRLENLIIKLPIRSVEGIPPHVSVWIRQSKMDPAEFDIFLRQVAASTGRNCGIATANVSNACGLIYQLRNNVDGLYELQSHLDPNHLVKVVKALRAGR